MLNHSRNIPPPFFAHLLVTSRLLLRDAFCCDSRCAVCLRTAISAAALPQPITSYTHKPSTRQQFLAVSSRAKEAVHSPIHIVISDHLCHILFSNAAGVPHPQRGSASWPSRWCLPFRFARVFGGILHIPPPLSSPTAIIYVNVASTRRTLAHSAAAAELTAAAWGGNDVEHEIADLDRTPSHILLRRPAFCRRCNA